LTPIAILADGAGTAANATFLLLGAGFVAWLAVRRIQWKALRRVPRAVAWGAFPVAAGLAALGLLLPSLVSPSPGAARPSSPARVEIISPTPSQVFEETAEAPARVDVLIRVVGAKVVPFTSTSLRPDQGHLHLFLDEALVSMTAGTSASLEAGPGEHVLVAEFVASDHGPFDPRVVASVTFTVRP
jgi:hypothetical protein